MSKIAVEVVLGSQTSYVYPAGYDQDQLGLGPLMTQNAADGWAGPYQIGVTRPPELGVLMPGTAPHVIPWSSTIDWVFLADVNTAAATRRVAMFEFDKVTREFTFKGTVTLTPPTTGNITIRAFRAFRYTNTTGTVEVAGTAVTGSGTGWQTAGFAVGARIGFGSTDPTAIVTWFDITAIGSDTGITLGSTAGTIAAGTSFVIEEIRLATVHTNATVANGGLFLTKGLNPSAFGLAGTVIPAATTVDNIRAVYWLSDHVTTQVAQVACGMSAQDQTSDAVHYVWLLNGTTTSQLFKHNIRAALTLVAGKDSGGAQYILKSGLSATLTGTASQLNNGRLATTGHGPGSGIDCIYFTTSTRIYRTVEVSTITEGLAHIADNMVEVPPGGTGTFPVTNTMGSIEYAASIDSFFIISSNGGAGFRSYVTQYKTDGSQMDRIFTAALQQLNGGTASADAPVWPSLAASTVPLSVWSEGGTFYAVRSVLTATVNQLYAVPAGADWAYAEDTDCRLVLPRMATPNCDQFSRVYVSAPRQEGGGAKDIGLQVEPWRIYYRTSGINDDSGAWTLVPDDGSLSGASGATYIQFMMEFRVIGPFMIPAKINNVGVVYDDLSTDSHYQPSAGESDTTNKRFAWRFSTAFGTAVPDLRVRLYDAVSGGLLVDDNTAAATGTFERSTDGGSVWTAWNNTDKANDTTYLRYTPAALGDNIRVRALLTLN